ncbi:MAG: type II secretion system minor pseudopilin GspI [Pseudomonadales bacterium]|nr:type II secretion system minor pseudopilin GspI [Pseudomonadales bacterium]
MISIRIKLSYKRSMRALVQGFTLLEIMIALAIFAIASASLIKNATQTIRQTSIIQERTIAYWVAENELNQIRAAPREDLPNPGSDRSDVVMANREWEVVLDIEATENIDMRRIVVSVYLPTNADNSIVSLTGFIGKY